MELLSVEVQEDRPPTRQLGGVDLYQRLQLVGDHLVALLVTDPDDHLDVPLVDRVKLEDLRRVGVEALDQDHGNHSFHVVLDLDVVWRLFFC